MAQIKKNRQQFVSLFKHGIEVQATVDPANLTDGSGESRTVTVVGALLGDVVLFGPGIDLQGLTVTGYVSATDTVTFRIQNESGGTLNIAPSTWDIFVLRPTRK